MKRPRVYRIPHTQNWGDVFTPYLLKHGFDIEVKEIEAEDPASRELAEVFSCGSLIERVPNGFTGHVLGSGCGHSETYRDLTKVKSPLLLRGELTAYRCECHGPARLGDPGLLASTFVTSLRKHYRYGIVPHYVDKDHPDIAKWVEEKGALYIDIESGIVEVIDAIASCELIVSSSLHGLVIADSLGIPNRFIQLSTKKIMGGGFKILDYYSTYREHDVKPALSIEEGFNTCRGRDVQATKIDVWNVFDEYAEWLLKNENRTDV